MPDTSSTPATLTETTKQEQAATPILSVPGKQPNEWPPLDPTRYGDWEKNGRCIDF